MTGEPEPRSNPVNYELDDLIALSQILPRPHAQTFRIAAGTILIMLMIAMIAETWSLTGMFDWPAFGASLFVAMMLLLFSNRRVRAWFWLRVARRNPYFVAHSFTITPSALRVSSPKSRSEIQWSALPDLRRVGDRLFVFMTKRQAFVIPRRAFDQTEDFEAFVLAARDRWEQRHRL